MSEPQISPGDLLRHLMNSTADHIYFKDRASRFICINGAMSHWIGLSTPEEAVGRTDFDFFSDEHARQAYEDEQRIVESGEPLLGKEEKETWPDGKVTWVSTTKMPLRSEQGEIIGTFGISRDITEHRLAKEKAVRYAWRLREINRQMRNELAMARELQNAFLPTRYPVFPPDADPADSVLRFHHHYHAAGLVGGDFFFLYPLSADKAAVFLCDVMGHGVQAALVTAMIRTLVNEWCPVERDPGALLSRINALLLPFLRREDVLIFATAFYMIIDVGTGLTRFACAGHPSPLWLKTRRGVVSPLIEPGVVMGPALALQEKPRFATGEVTLNVGDKFLLFTDGLYEGMSPSGEQYGVARLEQAAARNVNASLPALFAAIHADAEVFMGTAGFEDDVCMVGVELAGLSTAGAYGSVFEGAW